MSDITLTPAGNVPLSAAMDDSGNVLVEIGGETRRVSRFALISFLGEALSEENSDKLRRSIKMPVSYSGDPVEVADPFPGGTLTWNADGNRLVAGAIPAFLQSTDLKSVFGSVATVVEDRPQTFWEDGLVYDRRANGGTLYSFQHILPTHEGWDAYLYCSTSEDLGLSTRRGQTIFSPGSGKRITGAAIGRMSDDRVGGVVSVLDGEFSTGTYSYFFVYSDDLIGSGLGDSPTWTAVDISTSISTTTNRQPYGMLMPGPSGASGDWQVGAYGSSNIWAMRTVDNGANWTLTSLKDDTGMPTGEVPVETTIVELPDGWLMFARNSAANNMYVSTSANGLTWTDWADTGILLGSNPVHAVQDGGKAHVIMAYRDGFTNTELPGVVEAFTVDYDTCVENPLSIASLDRTRIADLGKAGIGYFQSVRIPRNDADLGTWLHFGKSTESPSTVRGASASRVRLSQYATAGRRPSKSVQAIANQGFGLSRIGTSWTTAGDGTLLADRWRLWAPDQTFDVSRVALTNVQRQYFPWLTHGLQLTQAAAARFHGLQQRYLGDDAGKIAGLIDSNGIFTCRVYGFGPCPELRVDLLINGNTLGTDAQVGVTIPEPQVGAGQPWCSEVKMSVEPLREMVSAPASWGAIASVDFLLRTAETTGRFNGSIIAGVYAHFGGPAPYEYEPQSFDPDERYMWSRTGSFARILEGGTISASFARFAIPDAKLFSAPTVTATPADLRIEGTSDFTPTDLTMIYAAGGATMLQAQSSGMTGGQAVRLKIISGSIILSTGF